MSYGVDSSAILIKSRTSNINVRSCYRLNSLIKGQRVSDTVRTIIRYLTVLTACNPYCRINRVDCEVRCSRHTIVNVASSIRLSCLNINATLTKTTNFGRVQIH